MHFWVWYDYCTVTKKDRNGQYFMIVTPDFEDWSKYRWHVVDKPGQDNDCVFFFKTSTELLESNKFRLLHQNTQLFLIKELI